MSTITNEQQASIASKLATMQLPSGLGDEQSACSIAAINLALSGRLTAEIPDCMSDVIGRWIIVAQDAMPGALRNSARWKSLLPLAAGTGREREQERLKIILDWMWGTVLPSLQSLADQQGFGQQWQQMTAERTAESASAASVAAAEATVVATVEAATGAAVVAATATRAAAVRAARAAREAGAAAATAGAATWAAWVAAAVAEATVDAARAVEAATGAATAAARATWATWQAWSNFDPCELLERLIKIDTNAQEAA
jgi:hypothetical protein